MSNIRLKRICFTLNNYGPEDENRIQSNGELYRYAIYGREVAPTTGTKHLQGRGYNSLFHGQQGECNWIQVLQSSLRSDAL